MRKYLYQIQKVNLRESLVYSIAQSLNREDNSLLGDLKIKATIDNTFIEPWKNLMQKKFLDTLKKTVPFETKLQYSCKFRNSSLNLKKLHTSFDIEQNYEELKKVKLLISEEKFELEELQKILKRLQRQEEKLKTSRK